MKATVFAAAVLSLLAAPAFARERDRDREEHEHNGIFRMSPEDFGVFQLEGMRGTRLGVHVSEMTDELRVAMGASADTGILVNRVVADSPAKKAGVQVGDIIVEVAGEPVSDVGDVWKALADQEGDVKIEVIREKRHVDLTAKIEKAPERMTIGFPPDAALRGEVDELRAKLKEMERRLEKLEKK